MVHFQRYWDFNVTLMSNLVNYTHLHWSKTFKEECLKNKMLKLEMYDTKPNSKEHYLFIL